MLDDSGHRREAYHLYDVPSQVKLISGDRGQKSSDLGRGPRESAGGLEIVYILT